MFCNAPESLTPHIESTGRRCRLYMDATYEARYCNSGGLV